MADKPSGARRRGRTLAFQVIYGLGFVLPEPGPQLNVAFAENPAVVDTTSDAARDFAKELATGVCEHREAIDAAIEAHSKHWKIKRIGRVELAILRLAIHEMLHRPDVPLKVAINEGVELAKRFGDENSKGFVNGILDGAAKAVHRGELTAVDDAAKTKD